VDRPSLEWRFGAGFTMSMSVGQSFALGENGYAVSGVVRKRRVAWTQALARMPVVSSGCDAKSRVHAFAAVFAGGFALTEP